MAFFSYDELRQATGGFAEANRIGGGAFGDCFVGALSEARYILFIYLIMKKGKALNPCFSRDYL